MLSLGEAEKTVLERAGQGLHDAAASELPLARAVGRVLAADLVADLDLPPFRRATMDGFALRAADAAAHGARLAVVGESAAGRPFAGRIAAGQCVRIFTGAALPDGADAVAMVERSRLAAPAPGSEEVVLLDRLEAGQNVAEAGQDLRAGQVALAAGTRISTAHVGLLASLGRTTVPLLRRPRVAILATGTELVAAHERPGPGMIRESNGAMLAALVRQAGGEPVELGLVGDDRARILERARRGLDADLFLLSGGSSVGDYDFTPEVLAALGVAVHFDRVAIKPGKPLLFGSAAGCTVFGLPGNPVSAFVTFHLFVRPVLVARAGGPRSPAPRLRARLAHAVACHPGRALCLPAALRAGPEGLEVRFVGWHGSGDVTCLAAADALLLLEPGDGEVPAGREVLVTPIDGGRLGDVGIAPA